MSAMISSTCAVACGSSSGGVIPSDAWSSAIAAVYFCASASADIPSAAARRMILSSMSVTLRTNRTSKPEARRCRTITSNATSMRACPTWHRS